MPCLTLARVTLWLRVWDTNKQQNDQGRNKQSGKREKRG